MRKRYRSLAQFLSENDISQAEFARRVGASQPVISRIATGKSRPSLPMALRIAAAARIPLESLVANARSAA